MNNKILVLGANGKTGKRVAERLKALQLSIRLGSRNENPTFDWNINDNWADVLEGIQKVYINFQPDLAVPSSAAIITSFVKAAEKAGVQKLVLLSGRGENEAEVCENIVKDSGLDWTIVRASWFMQNFSESFFLDSILEGHVVVPKINALEPFVDLDDLADVVVAALTDDGTSRQTYELTGPKLLSFKEVTAIISKTIHRSITFQEVTMEEYITMLKSYQVPEDFIWLVSYLFTEVLDGRNESLTNGVELALGRQPCSFENYAAKASQTGVWKLTERSL